MKSLLTFAVLVAALACLFAVSGCSGGSDIDPTPLSLNASDTSVTLGQSVTLTWSAPGAVSVLDSNFGAATVSGSTDVTPPIVGNTVYYLTVEGPNGPQSNNFKSVTIHVTPPPQ